MLIMLYVHHELGYDKFNENYENIYRLEEENYGKLPPFISEQIDGKISGLKYIAQLANNQNPYISYTSGKDQNNKKEIQVNDVFADSTVFDVFTFPFVKGNPETALKDPYTIVISESTAVKLFGNEDPIGKNIEYRDIPFMVTGVICDIKRFHLDIDVIFSREAIARLFPKRNLNNAEVNSWLWSATYLLLENNTDPELTEQRINEVLSGIKKSKIFDIEFNDFHLRPLKDIYFNGTVANLQYGHHGNLSMVRSLSIIAIFILILACINYINLTTARSVLRFKEVAIKKISGSTRSLLRYQFIFESILITLISFILAITLVVGLMSQFNQLAMTDINLSNFNTPEVWSILLAGVLGLGIISGWYPAVFLTNVKSIFLIKGQKSQANSVSIFRKALLTFQFSISVILIIGIITILKQMHYVRTQDKGFNIDHIITVITPSDIPEQYSLRETIREKLKPYANIKNVTFSTAGIGGASYATGPTVEIDGTKRTFGLMLIDPDFFDLMGIEVIEGRGFRWEREGESPMVNYGVIFNETAIREFGIASPIGKQISVSNSGGHTEIIGVVKDFHFKSFHQKIEPMCFIRTPPMHLMYIKISPQDMPSTIRLIEKEWKSVYGAAPFDYTFLDESYDQQYKSDDRATRIIGYFTILTIIIASLGLFALSSFMIIRRTKELGIRKSLGATSSSIFILLSKYYVKWVLIAVIIACPVAWVVMNIWLQTFAYRISMKVDVFIIAAVITFLIAVLTVAYESVKASLVNPVDSLRYE